jgi:two-component system response regulator FlrC
MPNDHRILIADDDRDFRLGLADLIDGLPGRFEILQAESGVEALLILRRQPFDLALLDMHMPGQTGLEVLSCLRRETRAVPCIFISGDATDAVREQALHEGASVVLKKPLRPELLRAEVRRLLRIDAA